MKKKQEKQKDQFYRLITLETGMVAPTYLIFYEYRFSAKSDMEAMGKAMRLSRAPRPLVIGCIIEVQRMLITSDDFMKELKGGKRIIKKIEGVKMKLEFVICKKSSWQKDGCLYCSSKSVQEVRIKSDFRFAYRVCRKKKCIKAAKDEITAML